MHYFILGPSGSGKSYVAERFADSISALWLEVDVWPPQDGITAMSLRAEWDAFLNLQSSGAICDEFDRRARSADKSGVVMSLPGFPILATPHAKLAADRAKIRYLSGTPGQCLDSFIRREKTTGRNLTVEHWCHHTARFLKTSSGLNLSDW